MVPTYASYFGISTGCRLHTEFIMNLAKETQNISGLFQSAETNYHLTERYAAVTIISTVERLRLTILSIKRSK